MYNSTTDHFKRLNKQQVIGGVTVDVPSSGTYVKQIPIKTRWSYSSKIVTVVENGVEQPLQLKYMVFSKQAKDVAQGDILVHPKTGIEYLVHTNQPIDGYSAIDHYEIEVSLYAGKRT